MGFEMTLCGGAGKWCLDRSIEPKEHNVKRPRSVLQGLDTKGIWMVGVTGIEPVTPTMST